MRRVIRAQFGSGPLRRLAWVLSLLRLISCGLARWLLGLLQSLLIGQGTYRNWSYIIIRQFHACTSLRWLDRDLLAATFDRFI